MLSLVEDEKPNLAPEVQDAPVTPQTPTPTAWTDPGFIYERQPWSTFKGPR